MARCNGSSVDGLRQLSIICPCRSSTHISSSSKSLSGIPLGVIITWSTALRQLIFPQVPKFSSFAIILRAAVLNTSSLSFLKMFKFLPRIFKITGNIMLVRLGYNAVFRNYCCDEPGWCNIKGRVLCPDTRSSNCHFL